MGWQEKLKEYIDKQEPIRNDKNERAIANIVRDIEKNELYEMWELLNTECREETERVYILETMIFFETQKYDKETGNINLYMKPELYFITYKTKQEAETEERKIISNNPKYITRIYHFSIRDIENMLRQIYRKERGII